MIKPAHFKSAFLHALQIIIQSSISSHPPDIHQALEAKLYARAKKTLGRTRAFLFNCSIPRADQATRCRHAPIHAILKATLSRGSNKRRGKRLLIQNNNNASAYSPTPCCIRVCKLIRITWMRPSTSHHPRCWRHRRYHPLRYR